MFRYATSLRAELLLRAYMELPASQRIFYVFWSNMNRYVGQCQRTIVFRRNNCSSGR
jgi:hypothetical protein